MEREQLIHLVQWAQAGNANAMDTLFSAFYNDVYYFALKTVKNEDVACDITQETFLEIIRTIGNLREPAAFVTWMKQITYHQCTRYFNKKTDILVEENEDGNSMFDTLADQSEGSLPAEVVEQEDFRRTIMELVDTLTEEQRSAVMLYYFDELSVGQIAQIQAVSEGTVKSRLNYARKALKKSVEDYEKKHDIKLHSFAPLALFLLCFGKEAMPAAKATAIRATVMATATGAAAGTAVGTGVATAAAATTAKAAGVSVAAKIIAGVVAAALVVGGITIALLPEKKDRNDHEDYEEEEIVAEPSTEEEETSIESELLTLYEPSLEYQKDFQEYLYNYPGWYYTKEGTLMYRSNDPEAAPIEITDIASEIYFLGANFCYYDSQGLLHYPSTTAEDIVFSGIEGAVFQIQSSRDSENKIYDPNCEDYVDGTKYYLATQDSSGVGRYYEYRVDGIYEVRTWEIADLDNIHTSGFSGFSPIGSIDAYSYFLDYTRGGNLYVFDGQLYADQAITDYKQSVDSHDQYVTALYNTGITVDHILTNSYDSFVFTSGDDRAVSIYFGQYAPTEGEIAHNLHTVTLPEGKTVSQIKQVIIRPHGMGLFLFDDGTVYVKRAICTHDNWVTVCDHSTELILEEELTRLYQAGQIQSFAAERSAFFVDYSVPYATFYAIGKDNLTYTIDPSCFCDIPMEEY